MDNMDNIDNIDSMESATINLQELAEKISADYMDNILIIPHINPDPDALGSALGLKWIFEKLNKTAYIVCSDKVNKSICGFFDIAPELDLEYTETTGFKPDYIICVDAASDNQIGKYAAEYYSKDTAHSKIDIVIDHHYTNTLYGKKNYIDEKAAATGEIIFNLAKELRLDIDKSFAKYIYCAIICDTGSFRYSSVTSRTMTAAAELISPELGFDFAKLNRLIYQNKSLTQVAIERLAYNLLKLCCGGKAAFITITLDIKKDAGLDGAELEGINEIARIIEGVEVGVIIKEAEPEESEERNNKRTFKISLRSNEYVNVAEIAAQYGGGGHVHAAGCKVDITETETANPIEWLEQSLIEKIEKAL